MDYLSLPLVMRDGYLARAELDDSIRHSVGLILSTRVGSIDFSPQFGCDLWDKEYADLYAAIKADVRASLVEYERGAAEDALAAEHKSVTALLRDLRSALLRELVAATKHRKKTQGIVKRLRHVARMLDDPTPTASTKPKVLRGTPRRRKWGWLAGGAVAGILAALGVTWGAHHAGWLTIDTETVDEAPMCIAPLE